MGRRIRMRKENGSFRDLVAEADKLSGNISFMGKDLLKLPDEMREVRGNEIGMIFQEPMNALNPVKKIGVQLSEVFLPIKSWTVRRPEKAQ